MLRRPYFIFIAVVLALALLLQVTAEADDSSKLDAKSEPPGVLPATQLQRLWDAYKTAGQCFGGPVYDHQTGVSIDLIAPTSFGNLALASPFTPVTGAADCTVTPGNLRTPDPIPVVKLDERYGQRVTAVDDATHWFQRLSTYLRLTNDPVARQVLKEALVSWAKGKSLGQGIQVSWGAKPVDYEMMTAIMAVLAATAEVGGDFAPEEKSVVGPWLNGLVEKVGASFWEDREDDKAFMRSYIDLLWGLIVGDDKAVQSAIFAYKLAIHDMRPDGSWPIDNQRGGMGIDYGAAATSYLVMIAAALQQARGIDLFSYQVDGRSIHSAVAFVVSSLEDPAGVNRKYAIACAAGGDAFGSINQPSTDFVNESGYLLLYAALFPDRDSSEAIAAKYAAHDTILSDWAGGSPPCQFAVSGGSVSLPPLTMPAPPPTLPAAKWNVVTVEELSHPGAEINALLVSEISGAPKDRNKLDFNIHGDYDPATKHFTSLRFILNQQLGLSDPKAFATCGGQTVTYDDGQHRAIIDFDSNGDKYVAENGDCPISALPQPAAFEAGFLLSSFQDIAIGLVKNGDVDNLKEDGLKELFRQAAYGEVTVSK